MSARLLVLAPNWLGDAVMALPAVAALVEAVQPQETTVAARASVAPLFTLAPRVDAVVTLDGWRESVAALGGGRHDIALLLPNSFNAARLAWRAGVPERWGYRGDFRSPLLTRGVTKPAPLHQVDYYRHLVRALGFTVRAEPPTLRVPESVRAGAGALLAGEGWRPEEPLVAIAPGAAYGGAKRWPAASFGALIEQLTADGVRSAIVGGKADGPAATEVLGRLGGEARVLNLVGRTDLPTLAGVLERARALVTNDSGAMHLAAALGVNVVAMFGPTRERETRPMGQGAATVLTHAVWCRPCMLRECPLTHRCMTGIPVDAAVAAARAFL